MGISGEGTIGVGNAAAKSVPDTVVEGELAGHCSHYGSTIAPTEIDCTVNWLIRAG